MFGRATIRLGIGPHSSFLMFGMVIIIIRGDADAPWEGQF